MADQRSKTLKCVRHPSQHGVGVCASCLKERLLDLLAAQNRLSPVELRPFPRSVSPSASRRRPTYGLFSTPQVGPVPAGGGGTRTRRFSLFSFFFGRRGSGPDVDKDSRSESGSWISKLVRARRRKPSKLYTGSAMPRTSQQRRARSDRGMSPAEDSDCVSESGYTSASSGTWRMPTPSPMRRTAVRHCGGGQRVSSFAICLNSPLVRPSPGRRRNPSDVEFSGGNRGGLAHNRSRKLVDIGRIR